ncbi:hypothetical protein COOONC_05587, partial [Cooperia oncophora]
LNCCSRSTISNIDINGNFCLTEQLPLEKEVEEERLKLGPKEEKSKKSKQDEALCMIKEAAAAVKAQVEKREAPSKEKSDDRIEFRDNKYWYFGGNPDVLSVDSEWRVIECK